MRKSFHITIVLIFSIWILPLGAFISVDKEARTCFGKRAICLCSQLLAKRMAKTEINNDEGFRYRSQPLSHDASGASPEFVCLNTFIDSTPAALLNSFHHSFYYLSNYYPLIDKVPKV